jgi:hypothetical protein
VATEPKVLGGIAHSWSKLTSNIKQLSFVIYFNNKFRLFYSLAFLLLWLVNRVKFIDVLSIYKHFGKFIRILVNFLTFWKIFKKFDKFNFFLRLLLALFGFGFSRLYDHKDFAKNFLNLMKCFLSMKKNYEIPNYKVGNLMAYDLHFL